MLVLLFFIFLSFNFYIFLQASSADSSSSVMKKLLVVVGGRGRTQRRRRTQRGGRYPGHYSGQNYNHDQAMNQAMDRFAFS